MYKTNDNFLRAATTFSLEEARPQTLITETQQEPSVIKKLQYQQTFQ